MLWYLLGILFNLLFRIVKKISNYVSHCQVPFLTSEDEECQYFSVLLLHDMLMNADSHKEFLEHDGLVCFFLFNISTI